MEEGRRQFEDVHCTIDAYIAVYACEAVLNFYAAWVAGFNMKWPLVFGEYAHSHPHTDDEFYVHETNEYVNVIFAVNVVNLAFPILLFMFYCHLTCPWLGFALNAATSGGLWATLYHLLSLPLWACIGISLGLSAILTVGYCNAFFFGRLLAAYWVVSALALSSALTALVPITNNMRRHPEVAQPEDVVQVAIVNSALLCVKIYDTLWGKTTDLVLRLRE